MMTNSTEGIDRSDTHVAPGTRPDARSPRLPLVLDVIEAAGGSAILISAGRVLAITRRARVQIGEQRLREIAAAVSHWWAPGRPVADGTAAAVHDLAGQPVHVFAMHVTPRDARLLAVFAPQCPCPARAGLASILTARQAHVGKLVANGATAREVAGRLKISVATVRRHLEAVHTRLGIRRRAELVQAFAMLAGGERVREA